MERLTAPDGPSGYEAPALEAAAELLRPWVDEASVDRFGNLVGVRRCGKPGARRLLLDAHLDQVGLVVTGVKDGFLRFDSVGGVDPRVLPDREVTVLTEPPLFGVITCLPPHVQSAEEQGKAAKLEDLYVDLGMSQAEAQARVPVGTMMTYRERCVKLENDRVCGRSMDDRACFAALVECARDLKDKDLAVDVYFLGSSREEVGGYGARTAAYSLRPDWCVAVDVTFGQSPSESESDCPCKLSGGPAIGVGPVIPRRMSRTLEEIADETDVPHQREVMTRLTGTNGDDFQVAREGIATAVVSVPLRYMHTPLEVVDLRDIRWTGRLLSEFAQRLGKEGEGLC